MATMAVDAWRYETRTVALVRLEEEQGWGGPCGPKRPNMPVGRLGWNWREYFFWIKIDFSIYQGFGYLYKEI
jgi:hypothetical protein